MESIVSFSVAVNIAGLSAQGTRSGVTTATARRTGCGSPGDAVRCARSWRVFLEIRVDCAGFTRKSSSATVMTALPPRLGSLGLDQEYRIDVIDLDAARPLFRNL
jgi:hypothetical protein